jgi:hypothetical protein
MKRCLFPFVLAAAYLLSSGHAAESGEAAKKSRMRQAVAAMLAEDARKQAAAPAPVQPTPTPASEAAETAKAPVAPAPAAAPATGKQAKKAAPPPGESANTRENPVTLPQVEVRKDRITELDRRIAKQEQDIAREKKNLVPTETDRALNDMKFARPLSIFGGESTQFRQHVASERVELMEAEKDLIEAIAHARTAEEKRELQKQLNEIRSMRRQLEKTLR